MAVTVIPGVPSASEQYAELIATAFADNPVTGWLAAHMDSEQYRKRVFREYFHIFVRHALSTGYVEVTTNEAGLALWLPGDAGPPPEYEQQLAEITGPHLARFATLDTAMEHAHPTEPAHHHLAFLAVAPQQQNTGHGSALLAWHHAQLSELGLGAYLEASAPRNRALYSRLGYEHLDASIELPEGPAMWPMLRPAVPGGVGR